MRGGAPAEQELDYRLLFQGCPGHFLVVAPDLPRYTILEGSQAYFQATSTVRDEVVGQSAFDVFPGNPDDPAASAASLTALRNSLDQAVASKAPHQLGALRFDIQIASPEGKGFEERYWTVVNTPILDQAGEIRYLVHQSEDITEFVRLRQQRTELLSRTEQMEAEVFRRATLLSEANDQLARLNERLHRNDQLKTQFFANVSHELRTPLTLILGPVERALAQEGRSEGDLRLLSGIKKNARLLLKHVNDILEITTLEAGKVTPRYVRVDLAALARQIASNFESLAEARGVGYQVRSPERLPAEVDPGKLQRIVLNLLGNAIKFTPAGGAVEFAVWAEQDQIAFSVADSGPGIPADLRERVFERFFQSEEAATRRYAGTGLGLSIVSEFVALHGGQVVVGESPLGGALFTVRLPSRAPQGVTVVTAPSLPELELADAVGILVGELPDLPELPEEACLTPRPDSNGTGAGPGEDLPTVLVVEDNREMAAYVCASLGAYRTRRARNGAEGLRSALAEPPDLIVSDIMMPGMSGPQMVEELRKHPRMDRVPVIMLTARAEDDLRIKLLRLGAQDYLVKPFSPEELSSRVDNLVRVKRFQEQLEAAYTELKATQVQLVHSAKMASLGQLVAGIAHEINNPLAYTTSNISSVANWVEQLSPHMVATASPELLRKWERIGNRLASAAEGIDRVKTLVLKLRTFSRLDEGEFKRIEVPETIESVLAFLDHKLDDRITVSCHYGPLTGLECFPGGLNQVLMNLISNAIDAIKGPGVIAITTSHNDTHFLISVKDSGPGLPEHLRDRIFDPFFTTKPVGVGTGLGLSISFAIMQTHRGAIRIEDPPEGGCEFVLEIPLDLAHRISQR